MAADISRPLRASAERIPQLGGKVPVALDPRLRELHVLTGRNRQRRQRKAQGVGPVLLDDDQRIDDVVLRLGHLLARLVADQSVDIDSAERHLTHEVNAHHHHTGDPEKDDVEAGHQDVAGIVALELGRVLGPAQGREWPERRRKPGVQHVGIAHQLDRFAVMLFSGGLGRGLAGLDENMAVGTVPGRDLMAPPELARNAPGLNVAHPVEVGVLPALGDDPCLAALHGFDSGLGQGRGVGIPLNGQPRLERHPAAVAVRDHVDVVLDFLDQIQCLEVGDDAPAGLVALEAAVWLRHDVVQVRTLIEDVDHLQIVAAADFEVVEIVGRRDLHGTAAGLRVGVLVGDHRDRAPDQGQHHALADQVAVSFVFGMDGNTGVAQHGLRPGRGDHHIAAVLAGDRISDVPELALHLALLHFEVGDRGVQFGVPVDQPLVLVNEPLAV
jgi:hypothetical protein